MVIQYNKEQLNRIIQNIFTLTGVSIVLLDTEYHLLASCTKEQDYCSLLQTVEKEQSLCWQCDQKILNRCRETKTLEHHICRAGLYDSAMPIIKDHTVVAFAVMGRIRSVHSPALPPYCPESVLSLAEKLTRLYRELPTLTEAQIFALYDLMPHILFNSAIQIEYDSFMNEVLAYINENLDQPLNVEVLCARFYVSAKYLYRSFRRHLNKTVNEYISERRIKAVQEQLAATEEPICRIAEKIGMENYAYFCRWFKKNTGLTPTEYRKNCRS